MKDLPRSLGLLDAVSLVVGTMIGSGIFLVPNLVARQLPSGNWILGVWAFTGVLTIFGALACAELGAMLPATGGQYVFVREAYGAMAGFLSGWTSFLIVLSSATAWLAVTFTIYLRQFIPLSGIAAKAVALLVIAGLTAINYVGIRPGAAFQDLFTALKGFCLAALVLAAFLAPAHINEARGAGPPVTAGAFGLAMVACLLSYDGWMYLSFVAGEIRDAARNIPRALVIGIGFVVLAYIAANAAYLRVMSVGEIAGADRVAALAATRTIGPGGGSFVALAILLSILGAMNGIMLSSPRICYAMARDGLFFERFATIHARFLTPSSAIVVNGVWTAILVITGTYESLAPFAMFGAWLFYGVTVFGVIVLRLKNPEWSRPYRMWGYPVTPVLFTLVAFGFVANTIVRQPLPALMGVAVIAAGVPVYWFWRRKKTAVESGIRSQKSGVRSQEGQESA